ncbi:MAG TPA: glycosyltransferase family protein [Stellaceae bacterium]|jgi:spore coat polysaccharide biosynthesis protein SpsF|nr:glycosyltransferase family protein [Stellaceae bacterium]
MTTACIVQARIASTRLPGKVLKDLAGEPVLGHVLRRCEAIPGVDVVVCATVDSRDGAEIESLAKRYDMPVHRGSETDVLDRYLGAARLVEADTVVRVTSDCPLIDPSLCGEVVERRRAENAEYAANNFTWGYPHGLDCEIFTRKALEAAAAEATEPYDREHVSPWIRRHPTYRKVEVPGPGGPEAEWRWTLDFPEDLDFMRALYRYLPGPPEMPSWREIAAVVAAHPDLSAINRARSQR